MQTTFIAAYTAIQIELRYSQEKIEFLDTWVKLENGRVYTDLYKKPSDKQLYLKKSSCHPSHTKHMGWHYESGGWRLLQT